MNIINKIRLSLTDSNSSAQLYHRLMILCTVLSLPFVSTAAVIDNWSDMDAVADIVLSSDGSEFWSITHGGLVLWNIEDQTFSAFSTTSGLQDNWNLCGARDEFGAVWFGSISGGLHHYENGQWDQAAAVNSAIPSREITCMDIDPANRLWAGFGNAFGNGIGIWNDDSWVFIKSIDGLNSNQITVIRTDASGAWVGTKNGLNRVTGFDVTESVTTADGLPDNNVTAVASQTIDDVWIGTLNGLAHMTIEGITVFTTADGLPDNTIQALNLDSTGQLHIGTPQGAAIYGNDAFSQIEALGSDDIRSIRSYSEELCLYAQYGKGVSALKNNQLFQTYAVNDPLPGNDVRAVEYHDGKVWFGTYGYGVGWFDGNNWWTDDSGCGIEHSLVRDIVVDHDGVKWFSTFGNGVYRYDDMTWSHFDTSSGLPDNNVVSGYVDRDNTKWFATWGGGIARFDNQLWTVIDESDGLPTNITYNVAQDKTGRYWFAMDDGVASYQDGTFYDHLTEDDGLVFFRVYDIGVASDNSLWFGACKGMSHYKDGNFMNYYAGENQLSHYRVRNFEFDPWGTIWIATGRGVSVFDGETFTSWLPSDGIAGAETYCVTRDSNGHFWFGSQGGLTRVQPEPASCADTGVSIVMPSNSFKPGDFCRVEVIVCSTHSEPLEDIPLFVILDVYGSYYFGPTFTTQTNAYFLPEWSPGETIIEIVPDFQWPAQCGSAESIRWLAGCTTPDMSSLIGNIGEYAFGWSE